MQPIRIYLALQVFDDRRVMFRRWSPDGTPRRQYEAQSIEAFRWLHGAGMPEWHRECDPNRQPIPDSYPFSTEDL